MKKTILFLSTFFVFIFPSTVLGNSSIFINEVRIDGFQEVEIINLGETPVDLSNWYLDDSGGSTYVTIEPNTILYPETCMRAGNNSINLNKVSADSVRLFDSSAPPTSAGAHIVDSFSYESSPGTVGLTYARMPDGSNDWLIRGDSINRWNATLQVCLAPETPTPTITPTPTPTVKPTPTPKPTIFTPTPAMTFPIENIYISEALVTPESGENEWIELYNDNEFQIEVSDIYVDDIENGGGSPKKISLVIPAKGYSVYELATSIFNNDGDTIRLLDEDQEEFDYIEYTSSQKLLSIGRISWDSEVTCAQLPSKAAKNNECSILSTPTPSPTIKLSPTVKLTFTKTPTPSLIIQSSTNISPNPTPKIAKELISKDYNQKGSNSTLSLPSSTKSEVLGITSHQSNKASYYIYILSLISILICILVIGYITFNLKNKMTSLSSI